MTNAAANTPTAPATNTVDLTVDLTSITEVYHPSVPGLLSNAAITRGKRLEHSVKGNFMWAWCDNHDAAVYTVRVSVMPTRTLGQYTLSVTFTGKAELDFLRDYKPELAKQLVELVECNGWKVVKDTTDRDGLQLIVSSEDQATA